MGRNCKKPGVADTEITPENCEGGGNLCGNEVVYGFFFGKVNNMRNNKGFTLIELMVVILIVAILAAVLAPMLTGRIREAKWTEGRAGAGTIATALRAYCAETGVDYSSTAGITGASGAYDFVGITDADLDGKYFDVTCYDVAGIGYVAATGVVSYTISVTAPACVGGGTKTLSATGAWSDGR